MYELKTFAPDVNPLTPGVCLSVDGAYPSEGGGFAPVPTGRAMSSAMGAACLGCFTFRDLDSSFRTIGGTSTGLYELSVADLSWTDVSNTSGYTVSNRWRYAAWGNWVLAANIDEVVQVQKTSGAAFTDLTEAPNAKYITASQNFVIIGNVNDTGTPYENRIQWSAIGDAEDWTPSTTTQAGYYDLVDTPGEITGLVKMGDYIVVFKESAIYLGSYVGTPVVWSFTKVGSFFGTLACDAIIETERGIFYPSNDDFYVYDGTTPQPIGVGIRKWFLDTVDRTYIYNMVGHYDGTRKIIFWHFPTDGSGGDCNDCLIYDINTSRWGRKSGFEVEAVLTHWNAVIVYDTIEDFWATYDDITTPITYDDGIWSETSFGAGYIGSDHILYRLNGTPASATLKTHYQGNPMSHLEVYTVWPYFGTEPSTCVVYPLKKTTLGAAASTGSASTLANGKADSISNARYIGMELLISGTWEIYGLDVESKEISRN
jgi:hypothetical protein